MEYEIKIGDLVEETNKYVYDGADWMVVHTDTDMGMHESVLVKKGDVVTGVADEVLVEPVEEGDYVLEGEHVEILHDIEEAVDELVGREGRLFVLEGDLKLLAESKMKKYEVNGVGFYDTESVRRFVLEELEKGRKVYVR